MSETSTPSLLGQNKELFRILQFAASCVGANVIVPNFRMNWLTWMVIIVIVVYYILTGYTIYIAHFIEKDWNVAIQALCYCGVAIQGGVKLANALNKAHLFLTLRELIDNVFDTYEHQGHQYQNALKTSLALIKRLLLIILMVYVFSIMGFVAVPLYYRLILGHNVTIMQFKIPGLDPNTYWGYATLQVVHFMCIFFGAFGNFASDSFCYMLVSYNQLMKDILQCKLNDLDEIVMSCEQKTTETTLKLRDVIEWHKKCIEYGFNTNYAFFWVIFVQMATSTLTIISTLLCLFLGIFPSAPALLIFSYVLLICYCALGNLVDMANDDITTLIYNALWYKMSVPEQKMIMVMLHKSQECKGMTIGGVSPLNLNTGVQLTKTIYSIAMLLNENLN